jgi:hypothetical protein
MNPGRELDKLIATKVMGLKLESLSCDPNVTMVRDDVGDTTRFVYLDIPKYSTDIVAAWGVVEKVKSMRPDPKEFGLEPGHHQDFLIEFTGSVWRVGWVPMNLEGNMTIQGFAETAPAAICEAALAALEALKEKGEA